MPRARKLTKKDEQAIVNLYTNPKYKFGIRNIQALMGIGHKRVKDILEKYGVPISKNRGKKEVAKYIGQLMR